MKRGKATRAEMIALREALIGQFTTMLDAIGVTSAKRAKPFSTRQKGDIMAGFEAGIRSAISQVVDVDE